MKAARVTVDRFATVLAWAAILAGVALLALGASVVAAVRYVVGWRGGEEA